MSPKRSVISVAVMSALFMSAASAAVIDGPSVNTAGNQASHPEGLIYAGGFEIRPTLGLSLGKNDNVGKDNAVKTSSNLTDLKPKIVIEMPTQGQVYSATYSGDYTRYASSARDNFNDHNFGLAAKNDWSTRVNSLVNVDYIKGHDARNSLGNGVAANGFVQFWHSTGIKGMVHYGAEGAQGQFELSAGQVAKRYDTDNGGTNLPGSGTALMNNDTTSIKGDFFYRVAPATQMIVEVGTAKYSYADAVAKTRDSNELQYMVGVKWDATAKTTGSFKIGQVKKKFNLAATPSGTNTAWDADITWSPLTYSVVNFALHQKAGESFGTGSFVVNQDTNVDWSHEWTDQVKSKLSLGDGVDTYQGIYRVNKRQTYGAKVTYQVNRWLSAGVDYQNTKRNSTLQSMTYTQNVTMLVLEGAL